MQDTAAGAPLLRALATRIAVRGALAGTDGAVSAVSLCSQLLQDRIYEVRSALYAAATGSLASVTDPYDRHIPHFGFDADMRTRSYYRDAAAAVAGILCSALVQEVDHGALWRLLRLVRRLLLAGERNVETAVAALSVSVNTARRVPALIFEPAVAKRIAAVVSTFIAENRAQLWQRLSPFLEAGHPVKLRAHCIAFLGSVVPNLSSFTLHSLTICRSRNWTARRWSYGLRRWKTVCLARMHPTNGAVLC